MQDLIDARVHSYYWEDDLNCVMTTVKILGELYEVELTEQLLSAVDGLNAGREGLQCGLVQGALLFIGLYSQQAGKSKLETDLLCRNFTQEFQSRFSGLQCRELRPAGFNEDNPPHMCESITKAGILFAAEFIRSRMMA